ncbi:MAG: molybdopterin-binding protein [Hyphomonadaceae bacterium]
MTSKTITAAVLLIGDEILSGRTQDVNVQAIALFLAPFGIQVHETRTVLDEQADIVKAVNELRARYTYVFTTGGIGPTHDDITADAIAAAFQVEISENSDALAIISKRYRDSDAEITTARRRMARIPHGASLILNPVSGAPGFQMENVFTLAGVPTIARGMLEDVGHRLKTGAIVHSVTVRGKGLREGDIAVALGELVEKTPEITFGSYPWFAPGDFGAHLVARGTELQALESVVPKLVTIIESHGGHAEVLK